MKQTKDIKSHNPEESPEEYEKAVRECRLELENRIVIAKDGTSEWAVVDQACDWIEGHEGQAVVYGSLVTREGAEMARRDAIGALSDPSAYYPYGPNEVPLDYWEREGAILRVLRDAGVEHDDLTDLASRLGDAARFGPPCDEIPF